VPAISLPLFELNDLPLGLQAVGYFDRDADAFKTAAWLRSALTQAR
jgi:Asp-tRNA(Asn)/Glu-tRNA(Gln) amidotransferase A subunit family amidase